MTLQQYKWSKTVWIVFGNQLQPNYDVV